MATSTITNIIADPSGTVVTGVTVTATLMPGPGFRIDTFSEVARQVSTTTDGSGTWSLALERQANITPASSWWTIEEDIPEASGGRRVWAISVGASNATLLASLVTPAQNPALSVYLTQAAADARYLALSAAIAGQWFYPETYGIVGGTGQSGTQRSANTVALQACLTAACAANPVGRVKLQNIYEHTGGLTFTKGLLIDGDGWNTTQLLNYGSTTTLSRTGGADTTTGGIRLSNFVIDDSHASGSTADSLYIQDVVEHVMLDHMKVLSSRRDGVYLEGGTASNTGTLYPLLLHTQINGQGRDSLHLNGGVNRGLWLGGRCGAATRYGLNMEDTVTGSPGSYPNGMRVMGVDFAGSTTAVYDDGNGNSLIGCYFEGNTTDLALGTHSLNFTRLFCTPSSGAFVDSLGARTLRGRGEFETYERIEASLGIGKTPARMLDVEGTPTAGGYLAKISGLGAAGNRGSGVLVQMANASSTLTDPAFKVAGPGDLFQVDYNGRMRAQGGIGSGGSSAGSTLGTVVKKLPIYAADGTTLLGYLPIYNAIT